MAEKRKASSSSSEKVKPVRKTVRKASKPTNSAAAETPQVSTVQTQETGKLSDIQTLFRNAWALFKQTFVAYLKLVGVGIGLIFAIGVIGLILALPLMISSGGSASSLFSNPAPLQVIGIILVILWAIVSFVVMFIYFLVLPIANILILDSKEKLSIATLFKKAKPLLLPYLLVSLVVGLLTTGGWILLIVPGLLISIFFAFVSHVFVLEGKRGMAVLRRSYQLVKEHFWAVVLRILVIQGLIFLGSVILDNMAEQSDFFSFVSFVFSVVAGWFAQTYMYLLYKQVSARIPSATAASIKWMVIVSIIGWIALLGLIAVTANGSMPLPEIVQSMDLMNSRDSSLDTL